MVTISARKLQHVSDRHAADFGIIGPWSKANGAMLEQAIPAHVSSPAVQRIVGTYRGTIRVAHHYDPIGHLNVMVDLSDNLVSGWKLSPLQVAHLLRSGNIQSADPHVEFYQKQAQISGIGPGVRRT